MANGALDSGGAGVPSDLPTADTLPRFYDLLRVLCEHEVAFVLIGGFAVSLQGFIRTTRDIDIVPEPTRENVSQLWDALTSVDARPAEIGDLKPSEMPMAFTREGLIEGGGNCLLYTTLGRIDLMPYVEDTEGELTYEELRASAERVDLPQVGHPIWVASVEHLIGMKEHANRDQDRIDITALRMAHGLEED
jgi:hypothetical protein